MQENETASIRHGLSGRLASPQVRGAIGVVLVVTVVGVVGLSSGLILRHAHAALSQAMAEAKVESAALRDATVAIKLLRRTVSERRHAVDPAQMSLVALQAAAHQEELKASLREFAERFRSLPAGQARDQQSALNVAFAEHLRSPGSEFQAALIESQLARLTQTLDADIEARHVAIAAGIHRLEPILIAATLIGMVLAAGVWLAARRIGTKGAPTDGRIAANLQPQSGPDGLAAYIATVDTLRHTLRAAREREADLQHATGQVEDALEKAHDGVMLIDPAGRLVFANETARAMDGFVEILRASLSAPRREQADEGEVRLPDGRWLRIRRSEASDGSVLAVCSDISNDTERLARLNADNQNLRMALDCMSQGLCLYDAAHSLVVVNRRYCEIYGLDPAQIRRGMTGQDLLRLSFDAGNHPGNSLAELLAEMQDAIRQCGRAPIVQKLGDGKVIQVHNRPTADGGFVGTYEDVSERWHAEARIAHMARHDALTGLPNRVLFAERIEAAITQADRDSGFAVLCLDLDKFKPVNDGLGHAVGDELLRAVAHRLQACLREGDTVARLGGDEFAIVQIGVGRSEDVEILARHVIAVVSEPYELAHHNVSIGLSIGIALSPSHGMQAQALLKNADLALYRAKDNGRGTHCFFEPEMDARVQARRQIEIDLRAALAASAFELHYQPIYDLRRDRICGFEALLRWCHPQRGNISPAEFVPIAEEIGLIVPLGEWVARRACAEAASWPDDLKVAVNISAAQFQSAQLVEVIRSALAESGLAAARLELEITESVLLVNGAATRDILHALRGLGARVSMDDFGTGYSSLSYLRSFPFDKMKVDRSFIRDLTVENGSGYIVRAVISLGSSLGMTMTAEGVETEEQLARLREENCDEVQGFLFSPPVPIARVPALLERWNAKAAVAA